MEHAYLLPYSSDIVCTTPVAVYHTVTKEASQRRIRKQLRDFFPTASEGKLGILKRFVSQVLETEDSDEAWEVRIQNFGHTILALRNTEHTLQTIEKRHVYHVVVENMELETWDTLDVGLLVVMYLIGFWFSWFLQLYAKAPMEMKTNCGTYFPGRSNRWL